MKAFLKMLVAVLVGGFLLSILTLFLVISIFIGIGTSQNATKPVKNGAILHITFDGELVEQAEDNPLSFLMGQETNGLDQLLSAVKNAKTNKKIKGIFLDGGNISATPAMLEELRQALSNFKESKKFIYAHADNYTNSGYYVSSVADELTINPTGAVDWRGLSSHIIFFRDLMDKLGLKAQVFKVGTYKSAVEPFTNTQMSEANRQQITSFLGSIWTSMVRDVSKSRKLTPSQLNAIADSMPLLQPTQKMKLWGLVDDLAYTDQVKERLKKHAGLSQDEDIQLTTPKDLLGEIPPNKDKKEKIAVYYAWGDIVTAPEQSMISGNTHCIVGDDVIKDLCDLRKDKDIKAVVLRINSGGGSAFASEGIWREITLLKEVKPVVVSMGGMAASGGYYISAPANRIWAEPTTLTGSIGVFGIIPDASKLLTEKIGLKFDVIKTNRMADFNNMGRSMNKEEQVLMQRSVENTYNQFIKRVSQGRKLREERVREIAEGRVWTGIQAKELGLVDNLGGLQEAIADAAQLAKLKNYYTATFPVAKPWLQSLLQDKGENYFENKLRQAIGQHYDMLKMINVLNAQDRIQTRIPFLPNIQ